MTRDQLEHAIRAACDLVEDNELYIFGSQAILGKYPSPPPEVTASIEVDVQPKNHPERVDLIDGTQGEGSNFQSTHGFYIHGVSIQTAKLPKGWEERCVPVRNAGTLGNTGYCLEPHDLSASKLAAFREKDKQFVITLLRSGLIDKDELLGRIRELPIPDLSRDAIHEWTKAVADEIEDKN